MRPFFDVFAKKVEKFSIFYWENWQSGAILNKETFLLTKKGSENNMGNLKKRRRKKIAKHKRKKQLKALRHKNK